MMGAAHPFTARPFTARPFTARPFTAHPFTAHPFTARLFAANSPDFKKVGQKGQKAALPKKPGPPGFPHS